MISFTYESLFRQDSVDKQISITGTDIALTNADIFQGSFEITESLNTGDDLAFGSFVSSCMKFTTSAIESSFIGKTLTVKMVVGGHTNKPLSIGTYKVVEEKWTANRTKKEITAYDSLYDVINKDVSAWYNSLTFPITVKNFRNSFFSHIGITQSSTTLINDSIKIYNSIAPSRLSGGEVLRAILELNGCFGRMKRNNLFEYKTLSNVSVYSITTSMYTECKYEDYTVNPIDKVIIREEEDDIGGEAGEGNNALIIQGNFLVYGNETSVNTIATNILNSVSAITYVPAEISVIGNPCVEVGDLVTITKKDGTSFNTYVLSRKLSNIQSIKDEYTATGNPNRINDLNTYNNEWIQLLGKTNKLTRTLDGTISQVGDLSSSITTLEQTTDSINLQIESIQEQLDGETQYYERNGEPTLLNYPYWDFTSNIPCNDTVQTTDDLKFIYTEQDRKNHLRALCVDMDNGNGYRFIQEEGTWVWKLISDSNFSYLYNRIAELEITIDGISGDVSDIEVDLSSLDSRITTNSTNITQTSNAITAEITRATTVEETLTGAISTNASNLASEISRATSVEALLSANITATASSIITQVSATYQPISAMSNYQPVSAMSNYWTISQTSTAIEQTASTITQSVATTYATKTQLEDYQTISGMGSYQTKAGMSAYQTVSGMSVYCTLEEADSKIGQSASSITAYVSGNYQLITAMSSYPTNTDMANYVSDELADYSTTSTISNLYYTKLQTNALLSLTTSTITAEVHAVYQPISAMSNYPTTSAMSNYVSTELADYPTTSTMTNYVGNELSGYPTTSTMTNYVGNELSNYPTTSTMTNYVGGELEDYYDKDTADGLFPTKNQTINANVPTSLQAQLNVHTTDISAKVSKNSPSGQTSFSWEMTDSKMEWKKNGSRIMLLNSSGLEISGKVQATSGFIGQNTTNGFTISNSAIYNGMTSLSDTSNDGIYLGKEGIALGKGKFKVTKAGVLTATDVSITGQITATSGYIGNGGDGFTIGNTSIYNGLSSLSGNTSGIYLGIDGIALGGGNFKVTNQGFMTAKSGTVGGWALGTNKLSLLDSSNNVEAYLTGEASNDPRIPSNIELGSEDVLINAVQTSGYAPVAGRITLNANGGGGYITLRATGNITLTSGSGKNINLWAGSNIITFSNGKMETANQHLKLYASSEADYPVELGVQDSMWAFMPAVTAKLRLGSPNHKWITVYAQDGTINTSDRNEKKDIISLQNTAKDFIMKLDPVSYKFKDGKRTHYGLIAQDVEDVMKSLGITEMDFAGLCKDKKEDSEDYIYGLRYEEFIAPLIKVVQMQQKEIEELKKKVGEWTNR